MTLNHLVTCSLSACLGGFFPSLALAGSNHDKHLSEQCVTSDSSCVKKPTSVTEILPLACEIYSGQIFSDCTHSDKVVEVSPLPIGQTEDLQKVKFSTTPLQLPPSQLFNLETANQQPSGSISITLGTRIFPATGPALGTGLQVFNFAVEGGVTSRLQLGLTGLVFDDTLPKQVNEKNISLQLLAVAPSLKYQLLKDDHLNLALSGSFELLRISSEDGLFTLNDTSVTSNNIAGTLKLPLTYSINRQFQLHFTPAAVFFPETINNGAGFYGTFVNLGGGFSWQPLARVNLFADVNVPLGPGDNAVRSSDGSFFRSPVWSAGIRYLVNPAVGLDLYATNALGLTPATQYLAFLPDANQVGVGANLRYTPDIGQGYSPSFRGEPRTQLSTRDTQLLLDGLTLTSADTLLPGMVRVSAGLGIGDGLSIAYGLTNDVQIELIGEQFREDLRFVEDLTSANRERGFAVGPALKIRFLDQVQGDPFSLSLKASGLTNFDTPSQVSILTTELPMLYQVNSRLALLFNPKASLVSSDYLVGFGLGLNYELYRGLQLIGEVTPLITGEPVVWSAGVRYLNPKLNLGIEFFGSNALGQNSIGSLTAAAEGASVGFNILWLTGGRQ